MLVEWEEPEYEDQNGEIVEYRVTYWLAGQPGSALQTTTNGTTLMTVVDNLQPFSNYSFKVAAATAQGYGPDSNPSTASTDQSVPSRAPPRLNVSVTERADGLLDVALVWGALDPAYHHGVLVGYTVAYTRGWSASCSIEPDETATRVILANTLAYTLLGLPRSVGLHLAVSARTSRGDGVPATHVLYPADGRPCAAPQNVTAAADGSDSLLVQWAPLRQLDGNDASVDYVVWVVPTIDSNNNSLDQQPFAVTGLNSSTAVITGLTPFTVVSVQVAARSAAGAGPRSSAVTARTQASPPSEVVGLTASARSPTQLEVVWDEPVPANGPIVGYDLVYFVTGDAAGTRQTRRLDAATTGVNLTSLAAATEYTLQVTAQGAAGAGPATTLAASTREDLPAQPPGSLRVTAAGSTNLTLEWEQPAQTNGVVRYYQVRVRAVEDANVTATLNVTEATAVVTGLRPYTSYTVRVAAANSIGLGPAGAVTAQTAAGVAVSGPDGLSGTALNASAVVLSWIYPSAQQAQGPVAMFYVYARAGAEAIDRLVLQTPAFENVVVGGLRPVTDVTFSVSIFNGNAEGPRSAGVAVRTLASVCSPSAFELTAPTATSDRQCRACSTCTAGLEFQVAACTRLNDTQCTSCTVCDGVSAYAATPCSGFADAVCAPCGGCASGQYAKQVCDQTHATVCADYTVCNKDSQFEYRSPTTTSDRVCRALTTCAQGTFEVAAPTPTTDRRCSPPRDCDYRTEFEFQPPTDTSDRVCYPLTECNFGGEFQAQAPTVVSDRVCTPFTACNATQYQTRAPTRIADRICSPLTPCQAFEFQAVAPTSTTDRACTPVRNCTALVEYEAAPASPTSNRVCQAVTPPCQAPAIELAPPTATSDRQCLVTTSTTTTTTEPPTSTTTTSTSTTTTTSSTTSTSMLATSTSSSSTDAGTSSTSSSTTTTSTSTDDGTSTSTSTSASASSSTSTTSTLSPGTTTTTDETVATTTSSSALPTTTTSTTTTTSAGTTTTFGGVRGPFIIEMRSA